MKKIVFMEVVLFMFIVCGNSVLAGEERILTIMVQDLRNNQGQIIAKLHKGDTGFPRSPFQKVTGKIEGQQSTIIIKNLPIGEYAVTVCHDENSNGKMDHDPSGSKHIEGVGVSNNIIPSNTLPLYSDSKFSFNKANTTTTIKVKY